MATTSKAVLVIGSGGHAGVVAATAKQTDLKIKGYVAPFESKGTWAEGLAWIMNDEELCNSPNPNITLLNGIGSTKETKLRREIYDKFTNAGYTFEILKHGSAIVNENVFLGQGTQLMAGVILQSSVKIGENVIINTGAIVDHDSHISSHVHIAPGVTICGGVSIGTASHVGSAATIIQGVKIGENSIIGAGSVVIEDVADNTQVVGVPARACSPKKIGLE